MDKQLRAQLDEADVEKRLQAIRAAARHGFPTADIDQMLAEIERGYPGDEAAREVVEDERRKRAIRAQGLRNAAGRILGSP